MKTEPNEPAHPCEVSLQNGKIVGRSTGINSGIAPGLTKREYFAAMAMQGLISNAPDGNLGNSIEGVDLAAQWADALINSLNKSE